MSEATPIHEHTKPREVVCLRCRNEISEDKPYFGHVRRCSYWVMLQHPSMQQPRRALRRMENHDRPISLGTVISLDRQSAN